MRRLMMIAGLSALVTPAAADSGFYMGVYGGAAHRNTTSVSDWSAFVGFDSGNFNPDVFPDQLNQPLQAIFDSALGLYRNWTPPPPDDGDDDGGLTPRPGPIDPDLLLLGAAAMQAPERAGITSFGKEGTISWTTSPLIGAVFGKDFGNGWRVEGDISVTAYKFKGGAAHFAESAVWTGRSDDGENWQWNAGDGLPSPAPAIDNLPLTSSLAFVFANAWYDVLHEGAALTPYLGGGIGGALLSTTRAFSPSITSTAHTLLPAAQLGAGVRWNVADGIALDLGYRYRMTPDAGDRNTFARMESSGPLIVGGHTTTGGPINIHLVQLGLSLRLP